MFGLRRHKSQVKSYEKDIARSLIHETQNTPVEVKERIVERLRESCDTFRSGTNLNHVSGLRRQRTKPPVMRVWYKKKLW